MQRDGTANADGGTAPDGAAERALEDELAAVLSDVEALARCGHVAQATARAASLPPLGPAPLAPLLGRLRADGFREEAAVIELGWRQPLVLDALHRAERSGWIAAVVAFVAFFWPARIFAAIPAMGARLLVSELALQLSGPRVLKALSSPDRRHARMLWDLSIYSTRGTNRLGGADATMLTLGGIVLYGVALWARASDGNPWLAVALTAGGTIMAFAGAFAIGATRRLRHCGIRTPRELRTLPASPVERPPTFAIEQPIVFARPRLARSLLVPALLVIIGVPSIMAATAVGIAVGTLSLVAVAVLVRQAVRSVVVIGPEGDPFRRRAPHPHLVLERDPPGAPRDRTRRRPDAVAAGHDR